jgi:pectinesterase
MAAKTMPKKTEVKKTAAKLFYCLLVTLLFLQYATAQHNDIAKKIIVSKDGKGDFNSIQAAINSLSDSAAAPRIIFIKKGVYKEKVYIEKHNLILEGEDRENTILTESIARDVWRCLHNEDWGVATLNVDGNDITLKNLTITNSYGFDWKQDVVIYCASDTISHQKKITQTGHQMAMRTMNTTRLKAINCHFTAFGGDTVSPWNVDSGLFYFKDCIMEGGVDFYCPRGWAYAENCEFIAHTGSACIWHDGSMHEDSKTVLKNCSFKGFDGFKLGRYHRDAQFYLINCSFAGNMANEKIYLVSTSNVIRWGERIYYYNCHRQGVDYAWFADNLNNAPGMPAANKINSTWVFGNRWNPAE